MKFCIIIRQYAFALRRLHSLGSKAKCIFFLIRGGAEAKAEVIGTIRWLVGFLCEYPRTNGDCKRKQRVDDIVQLVQIVACSLISCSNAVLLEDTLVDRENPGLGGC